MMKTLNIKDKDIIEWGIKEIKELLPRKSLVKEKWEALKENINSGGKVYIRGYGGDKKNGEIDKIQYLYNQAKFRVQVCLDVTNNSNPKQLMESIVKYKVGKEDHDNHEAIQNYKLSHVWGYTKNIYLFASPWNLIYTPAVIDPLTGHETYNNLKRELKIEISNLIFNEYKCLIKDYNKILKKDRRIGEIIKICENNKNERFYMEMKKQWTKLTRDNILQA